MTEIKERTQKQERKAGRPPKINKCDNCVMVRFTDEEYADFLADFERSGATCRAHYIKKRIKGSDFRVIIADKNTIEYYHKLNEIKSEIRKVGVNYNQYIAILRSHFTEQKAAMMSIKSAELLSDISLKCEKALQLTLQLVNKWLQK